MAGTGHIDLKFDGIITWKEFKKQINSTHIPDEATLLIENNGSSNPELRESTIHADWDMNEVGDKAKGMARETFRR